MGKTEKSIKALALFATVVYDFLMLMTIYFILEKSHETSMTFFSFFMIHGVESFYMNIGSYPASSLRLSRTPCDVASRRNPVDRQ